MYIKSLSLHGKVCQSELPISRESESEVTQSCPTLWDPMDRSLPSPPSMGFSRQEYFLQYMELIYCMKKFEGDETKT